MRHWAGLRKSISIYLSNVTRRIFTLTLVDLCQRKPVRVLTQLTEHREIDLFPTRLVGDFDHVDIVQGQRFGGIEKDCRLWTCDGRVRPQGNPFRIVVGGAYRRAYCRISMHAMGRSTPHESMQVAAKH